MWFAPAKWGWDQKYCDDAEYSRPLQMICQTPEFVVVTSPYLLYQIEKRIYKSSARGSCCFWQGKHPPSCRHSNFSAEYIYLFKCMHQIEDSNEEVKLTPPETSNYFKPAGFGRGRDGQEEDSKTNSEMSETKSHKPTSNGNDHQLIPHKSNVWWSKEGTPHNHPSMHTFNCRRFNIPSDTMAIPSTWGTYMWRPWFCGNAQDINYQLQYNSWEHLAFNDQHRLMPSNPAIWLLAPTLHLAITKYESIQF